jgi:carboxypeptidase Q
MTAGAILAAIAQQSNAMPPPVPPTATEVAAEDNIAFEITQQLTQEIGPRQGGTDAEQKARDWAVKKLKAMGFANVREESFMMPTWVRGEEKASITGPIQMDLSITALGNSGSTGGTALKGEIAYFRTFDDLLAAEDIRVKGKIVYVDHDMGRTQDGSSYGYFGRARFVGPNVAAKKGAIAILVRSAGSDDHDHPHTGNTNFDPGVKAIPSAAVSNADADRFSAEIAKAAQPPFRYKRPGGGYGPAPFQAEIFLTPKNLGQQKSGNVIAEVTGSNPALPPVLVACHLDSWDLGTGAFDDGAGCGIITAAASRIKNNTAPKRTIRILWAGAEEVGIWGGKDYVVKNGETPHALAMESDFGADRVWRVDFNLPESAKEVQDKITKRLALIGIAPGRDKAGGGADIGPIIAKQGLAVIDLQQDGTRYFDIHHTKLDTIDLIDKDQLRQNVVAWTIVLEELTRYEGDLKPDQKP